MAGVPQRKLRGAKKYRQNLRFMTPRDSRREVERSPVSALLARLYYVNFVNTQHSDKHASQSNIMNMNIAFKTK